jgi:hypothetical protein
MLQAGKGIKKQQGLVRGSPAAAGELTDAVELGEQGLAVERYGRWPIEGQLRHRAKLSDSGCHARALTQVGTDSNQLKSGSPLERPFAADWVAGRADVDVESDSARPPFRLQVEDEPTRGPPAADVAAGLLPAGREDFATLLAACTGQHGGILVRD